MAEPTNFGVLAKTALIGLMLATAANAAVKSGDLPPEIHFDKVLPAQPPAGVRFDAFQGKAVVVEMWATWCGGCVAAIQRLNQLAQRFHGKVIFLSVTDEEPAVVEAFLKQHPIEGLVGIAHSESPMAAWGVWGLPTTFLIDPSGRIAGSYDADRVTAATIEDVLQFVPLTAVELTVRTNAPPSLAGYIGRNRFEFTGTIRTLVSRFWDLPDFRLSGNALEDRTTYQVSIALPQADPSHFRAEACAIVAPALRIKVNRDVRDLDAWVLLKNDSTPSSLKPPGTIKELNNSGWQPAIPSSLGWWIKIINARFSLIPELLQAATGSPVVDETAIAGEFDFEVINDKPTGDGWIEAMRQAGFRVERAHRPIEYLIVNRAE